MYAVVDAGTRSSWMMSCAGIPIGLARERACYALCFIFIVGRSIHPAFNSNKKRTMGAWIGQLGRLNNQT